MMPAAHPGASLSALEQARRLRRAGRASEAAAVLQAWLRGHPDDPAALLEWGNGLKAAGKYSEALGPLRDAARLDPRPAAAWLNLGVALLELSRVDEAVAAFERAVGLEPERPEAWNILGHARLTRGETEAAAELFERALALRPGFAPALDNLGRVRKAQGRAAEAASLHRRALEAGAGPATASNLLYTLNLIPDLAPAEIFAEHARLGALYGRRDEPDDRAPSGPPKPRAGGRLRVGYVSPDLCRHAVAAFIEPVLAGHDRARVEVTCYSDVRVPDEVTARLRGQADHWRESALWSDDVLREAIRGDRIDVLVDLAGHTARNRLGVFARRAAPVQITWLGYPNTTGIGAMDFRLTDPISDPPGATERWHTERLARLPGPFSCFRPPAEAPAVAPLPAQRQDEVTFGCFNHLAKINAPVLETWGRLLAGVPGARLLLKTRAIDAATQKRLVETLTAAGAAPDRIEIVSRSLSVRDHLELYGRVDVALDPFPYNGTTTTCEALWMGVPVITLAGATHVSRVGASLLTHLGQADWIAASPEDYVVRAARLASDRPALAGIRAGLRERMRASPLCDERTFVRGLEEVMARLAAVGIGGDAASRPVGG
jgi:predicted O-linked N-acetylglucosamine transferase (SPINDLY family)